MDSAKRLSEMCEISPIVYPIGNSGQSIVFCNEAVAVFTEFQQKRFWMPEAGGQLFATFSSSRIEVRIATRPKLFDRRSRFGFVPSRAGEQREIEHHFTRGLHFIGDWHTHPELTPRRSNLDIESMRECFRKSNHFLNAIVLVVVGKAIFPTGLEVSLHDSCNSYDLFASLKD